MSEVTHEIELVGGYTDTKGAVHRRVVFGNRVTGEDLMSLDVHPLGQNPTQYQDLIYSESITEFGALEMKTKAGSRKRVPLNVLLDLDSVDREDIAEGYEEFERKSRGERVMEVSAKGATLPFGFRIGDLNYPIVEFGNRITGRDEVEADTQGLKAGIARMCFLTGRQISKIKTADGMAIDGPVELQYFKTLDGVDIALLRSAAELWRQSFRLGRGGVSKVNGPNSPAAGDEDRVERESGSGAAARKA